MPLQPSPAPQPGFFKQWGRLLGWAVVLLVLIGVVYFFWLVAQQAPRAALDLNGLGRGTTQLTEATTTATDIEAVNRFDNDAVLGSADAPITIVAFEDFQCPYCGQAQSDLRTLLQRHGTKVRFVYRDFPITSLHPNSQRSAEAAECAADQGQFWAYHDRLFANQTASTDTDLIRYATNLSLDVPVFTDCLESGIHTEEVRQDFADGIAAGVTGTPTFFINGNKVAGVVPLSAWEQIIDYFQVTE